MSAESESPRARPTPAGPTGFIGILRLDTRFPRPAGDIGSPDTFARAGIAVRFAQIDGVTPARVVGSAHTDTVFLMPLLATAQALQAQGAWLLSTSCGLLAGYQGALAAALQVPVISSSLLQCRELIRPGIVTFDAQALSPGLLQAAGVAPNTPVSGLRPGCELQRRILNNDTTLDLAQAERDVVDAAVRLVRQHPGVQEIVLECTNMPPYRQAVSLATGRQVHDLETLLLTTWSQVLTQRTAGVRRRD